MKTTAIIGLGITGLSCLRHLYGRDRVVVLDTRADPPMLSQTRSEFPDAEVSLSVNRFDFGGFDRVVVSPGVDPRSCLVGSARAAGVPLESDIDLFCDAAEAPIVAITGTNGKSTVTSLVGHILMMAGGTPGVGGNLGDAALDLLDPAVDCYVLELSSFQLERLRKHHFHAASILNISEDHIDRHGTLAAYAASKQRIYRDCAVAIANRADSRTRPECPAPRLVTFGPDAPDGDDWGLANGFLLHGDRSLLAETELPIRGRHNALNALAAFALASACGVDESLLAEAASSYRGLPHRCELVAEIGGVRFINDSKATNVGATVAALNGLGESGRRNIVLIAGGDGKGADFSALRGCVGKFVKRVIVLGMDARRIEQAVGEVVEVEHTKTLEQGVGRAAEVADPGDVVLLSPACASLDMFDNYAERGARFAEYVRGLEV